MDKKGLLLGMAGAGLAYLGLNSLGVVDTVFDYFRITPNTALQSKNVLDGLAMMSASVGVIGSIGNYVKNIANHSVGKVSKKACGCLEGLVDSGLSSVLIGSQAFRDNLLYKWNVYSPKLEAGLDNTAGLLAITFLVAFAGTFLYDLGKKI